MVQTFAQCAAKCVKTPGCKAIELWHKYNWNCYWCKRTDLITPYTNTRDLAYPAHVWVQSKKIFDFLVQYLTIRKKQFSRAGFLLLLGVSLDIYVFKMELKMAPRYIPQIQEKVMKFGFTGATGR